MARRKTVKRAQKSHKHLFSRNKKIVKTQKEQNKIPGWNKNISFTQNLNNLGMNTGYQINQKISNELKKKEQDPQQYIEAEEISIDQIKELQRQATSKLSTEEVEKKKNKVRMNIDDEWAIEALVKKYQQNWEAMKRDHKLNTFQWTAIQCQKKYNDYIKRYGKCPKSQQ
ncbi:unnamed protein product [Paramecium primaurelia]|uniref:Nucleolar protein 16 n=2 Tax=Paramecium TaxID=5884 RepID=A0A8S1WXX2_9CILI|nr:unnamed protein product [Paramecium primaurelia]CAD8194788.1 unnamed protein product [Paramecium pentaurelia]